MIGNGDIRLVIAALAEIALTIVMIVRDRLRGGTACRPPLSETVVAVQKGVGDIIGGTGLVVALGRSLGSMLHLSGAAASLATGALRLTGARAAPYATLGMAIVIGLPARESDIGGWTHHGCGPRLRQLT